MKNCYNLVGASWEAIYLTGKNEAEQNKHIKEKYEFTKRQLEFKMKNPNITQERLEELLQQRNECDNAYEKIKTAELREIYNEEVAQRRKIENWKEKKREEFEQLKEKRKDLVAKIATLKEEEFAKLDKYAKFKKQYEEKKIEIKRTPYQILDFNPETLSLRSEEENDAILEERKNKFLEALYQKLEKCENLTEFDKITEKIVEIKEAYQEVATETKRKEYEEKERKEEISQEESER